MSTNYIYNNVQSRVRKSKTRNPFVIAEDNGIMLLFDANLKNLKGMYTIIKRNRIIIINDNMPEQMQNIVCAHELGHDALHRSFAKNGALQEFMLYDMKSRRRRGKSCVNSIKTNLLGENYGRNNFYQGGFST